jgi:hypothetical protein
VKRPTVQSYEVAVRSDMVQSLVTRPIEADDHALFFTMLCVLLTIARSVEFSHAFSATIVLISGLIFDRKQEIRHVARRPVDMYAAQQRDGQCQAVL